MSMSNPILVIKDLSVAVNNKTVIKNFQLTISGGEVHALMGPNGSGKSTLANVLARHPDYQILSGSIEYQGQDLLALSPEEVAQAGVFLSFQHPVPIPGVSNLQFIKASLNAIRKSQNKDPIDSYDFLNLVKDKAKSLNLSENLLQRAINDGFSGGEKKRNEILQLSLLEPTLSILDEIDSGLDIDALKDVAQAVNTLRHPKRAILLITHYQRLLDHITPDYVHILADGQLIHSGDKTLPLQLEQKGYEWLKEEYSQ